MLKRSHTWIAGNISNRRALLTGLALYVSVFNTLDIVQYSSHWIPVFVTGRWIRSVTVRFCSQQPTGAPGTVLPALRVS